ncbi:SCO family protein [Brevundimonas diminuta]|jgi:protein SCO1/2|uniref:SCO family protein n=1 Tax=Brevundimonas diminuta TaxID=293 RepID=A0A410NV04_BREDI|nr:SCO family protein [Brevundimonas diminuta]MBD3572101.1 SCO family protein [Brevundimonas diminuta]QAT13712.1 SCO family protein [Brevundimonas diminuta]QQB88924.1 SCO family protein [Brevundimonas diminuta]GEB99323.1 photosynthetic protein synthase I [Brevundimonas diminuta]HRL06785.1 SCO family protein [Brevundimonas diminuta]
MPRRPVILFAAACAVIALALGLITMVVVGGRQQATQTTDVATGQPLVGGDFTLTNQDGQVVDQTILNGKWTLVFFGFTYCPDYCPTTLGVLNAVQERMGDKAEDLQIVFISIDPERDTPQMLKDYLSSDGFPDGVIGLTGTPEQVAKAAKAYRAFYQKVGEGEGYTMNHGLTVYLMGPDGKFRSAVAHDLGPSRTATLIENAMEKG